jgi:type IV pilus assembly protein PilC
MDKSQKLKKRIVGAAVYPIAVLSVAGLILAGIMIFVVPKFKKIFADLGVPLPAITEFLIAASDALVYWWYLFPLGGIGFYIAFQMFISQKAGRLVMDRIALSLPVFGDIIRKSSISRFTRTLGTLISSGVPILEALAIVRNAIGNQIIAGAISAVHESIKEGENIAQPLANSHEFDDIVVNMIDVGEETGELDKMLMKIADNYDEEVDVLVGSMISLLEPMLIIFMGVIIGFIVIALFVPLIELVKKLG